jgi:hypothetical protein
MLTLNMTGNILLLERTSGPPQILLAFDFSLELFIPTDRSTEEFIIMYESFNRI